MQAETTRAHESEPDAPDAAAPSLPPETTRAPTAESGGDDGGGGGGGGGAPRSHPEHVAIIGRVLARVAPADPASD